MCAIVAVPLGVLKANAIGFDPPLSADSRSAIERLGMGNVLKVAIRAKRPFWGNLEYAACDGPVPSWWPGVTSARGAAILIGWAGGTSADELSGLKRPGVLAAIRRSLQILFPGHRDVADDDIKFMPWAKDEFTGGAYSYVPPGAEECPRLLAVANDPRIQFAGEAVDERFPTTVTGAVRSGRGAAQRVITMLV